MSAKTVAWIETSELERLHAQPLSVVHIYSTEQIARLGEPYPGENLVLRSDWEAEHQRTDRLTVALKEAAYALFQIKRMVPEAVREFASNAHIKACAVLDNDDGAFVEGEGR